MQISSSQYGHITLVPVEANAIQGSWLPGSTASYCEMDFGTILIQQYHTEQYSIRYILLNIIQPIQLLFKEKNALTRNRLALKGSFYMKSDKGKKVHVRESQLILLSDSDDEQMLFFEQGKEYCFFDTAYAGNFLQPLLTAFPSLTEFISNSSPHKEQLRIKQPRFALPEITRIAHSLLKCPYDENLRRIYFENKMKDYLFQAFVQTLKTESVFGEKEDAIYSARNIILADLTRHITIREISQQVRLNENKLKAGFKQTFGTGIFECLLQARMEEARNLLINTNKPIKEIASLTGFQYLTNFSSAFRKYYGDTPGELRNPHR